MDQTLFALPILLGKIEAARAFLTEIEGERKRQYATSEGRLFAGENIGRAFQTFATSQDEFDRWFKEREKETTDADLNTPPSGLMSEILSDFQV